MNLDPTWIVLIRDVSHAVRISGQTRVMASMVLDQETGLVRGASVGATPEAACVQAMRMALTTPVNEPPALTPRQVLCTPHSLATVLDQLAPLLGHTTVPDIVEISQAAEAEDIFDSFVGHMAGRSQPQEFATPADWQLLVHNAIRYLTIKPWLRWADDTHLDLTIHMNSAAARYAAVVLGQSGIQHGLVLHPGGAFPHHFAAWTPGQDLSIPNGTVLFYLDPPKQTPHEFVTKAIRYGWPPEQDHSPVWLTAGPDGPADLDRTSVQRLTVALAAVADHHTAPEDTKTTNTIELAGDHHASYTINRTAH